MIRTADVIVIGAGAVGVCCAYYTRKQGQSVILLDRGRVCSGSSYGNAGLIVPSHCVPLAAPSALKGAWKWLFTPDGPIYFKTRFDANVLRWLWTFSRSCKQEHVSRAMPLLRDMSLSSLKLLEEIIRDEELSFGFEKTGYLRLYKTIRGLTEGKEEAELVRSVGVDVEVLDAEQVRRYEPSTRIDAVGGIAYPEDAHLNPAQYVAALADRLASQGAEVVPFAEVYEITTSNDRVRTVKTAQGQFEAEKVVLCAGSWTAKVARHLGINILVEGAKGYSFTFSKPSGWPSLPFSLGEAGVAVTSMGNKLRVSGTFAITNLDDDWNRKRMVSMLHSVSDYLPDLDYSDTQPLEVWHGFRPCTPDGLPIIARSQKYSNLIVAAGHCMIGVSLSPITGLLVSQLIADRPTSIDVRALALERFDT